MGVEKRKEIGAEKNQSVCRKKHGWRKKHSCRKKMKQKRL